MKKTQFIYLIFLFLCFSGFSQTPASGKATSKTSEEIYTPLKPKDGSPAVFSSRAELESKKQSKINATLDLIRLNKDNAALVLQYRESLWRFENAIVVEPKTNQPKNHLHEKAILHSIIKFGRYGFNLEPMRPFLF